MSQDLPLKTNLIIHLDLLAINLKDPPTSSSPALELKAHTVENSYFVVIVDLNSGPHAYAVGISLTESSPHPLSKKLRQDFK